MKKRTIMSKKTLKPNLIGLLVLIVTLVCVISTATTYAVWQEKVSANKEVVIPVGKYNPSLKYLIFKGLNNAGEFATSGITKYAVVGYDGLVAEIIIPEVVTVEGINYPVVMIATDPDNTSYRLRENEFVTSIVIPASVTEIKAGALSGMTSLYNVIFEGTPEDADIIIGDLAFAYCTSLSQFSCVRNIVGDPASYFIGTQI
jgi:hypothetical protein